MKKKIDPKLEERIYALSNKQDIVDCLVYSRDIEKLEKVLIKEEKLFQTRPVKLPFISAIGVKVRADLLFKITNLSIVDYVSSVASVQAMMEVSKKILRVDEIHKAGYLGEGVTICYIDTGINPHLDFVLGKNRIKCFKNFINDNQLLHDDNGHGTFVCGVGSGSGRASCGKFMGVAPMSDIVALKALSSDGESGALTILSAMQWVYDNHKKYGIRVVCMSFGSEPLMVNDPIVKGAEMLVGAGIVVVAASGNSGPEYQTIKSPGVSQKIITVGGIDDFRDDDGGYKKEKFKIANFSSRGPAFGRIKPDAVAPAVNIISCSTHIGEYRKMSGTSVATPMIAGLCALIIQKYPHATPFQIKRKLISSCSSITHNKNEEGVGLVDGVKFVLY